MQSGVPENSEKRDLPFLADLFVFYMHTVWMTGMHDEMDSLSFEPILMQSGEKVKGFFQI